VGTSSFTPEYTLEQDGAVCARARAVTVAYDYASARPVPLTAGDRAVLEQWRV